MADLVARLRGSLSEPSDDRHIEAADKIDGLEADLAEAVTVAWKHGAHEWVEMNYPAAAASLKKHPPK